MLDIKREIMITATFPNGGEIRLSKDRYRDQMYLVEWKATDNEEWTPAYLGNSFTVAFKMYSRLNKAAMSDKIIFSKGS